MKKLLLLTLSLALSVSMFAQAGIHLELHGGPQSTWIMNKSDFDAGPILDYKSTWGYYIGAHGGINFSDNVGIVAGIDFSQQGQDYVGDGSGLGYDTRSKKLSYMKIPILFKYNTDPYQSMSFLFKLGPQFGFLTSATGEFTNDIGTFQVGPDILGEDDDKSLYGGMDLGIVMFLGSQYNLT